MKFSCLQENLSRGLSAVSKAISAKAPLPILENILIEARKGEIELSATDLKIGIKIKVGAKVEVEGALAVPARVITDLISTLPKVTLELSATGNILEVKTPQTASKLNGLSAKEFPKFSPLPKTTLLELEPELLSEAIAKTAFASATDDGRPILTGVLFKFSQKAGALVGVDGFRLAEYKFDLTKSVKAWKAVLPSKAVGEVSRLLGGGDEKIKLYDLGESGEVIFESSHAQIFVKTLEGEFPDYEKIIPQGAKTIASLPLEEFMAGLRTVSVFAALESGGVVSLNVEPENKMVTLSALVAEIGENETKIDAEFDEGKSGEAGEGLKICFNSKFLSDFLNAVKGEKITLKLTDSLSPAIVTCDKLPTYLYILMPVRVTA